MKLYAFFNGGRALDFGDLTNDDDLDRADQCVCAKVAKCNKHIPGVRSSF